MEPASAATEALSIKSSYFDQTNW